VKGTLFVVLLKKKSQTRKNTFSVFLLKKNSVSQKSFYFQTSNSPILSEKEKEKKKKEN